MNKIPRITEIIKVEPFKITVRWTTAEIRVIDFEPLFAEWNLKPGDLDGKLLDYESFRQVSLGESFTLEWTNMLVRHPYFNQTKWEERESPFDLDPIILYQASRPIEEFRLVYA